MAGARLNFIENRVAPLCSRLEAAEDITVKTIDPQASGWFDLDSLPILQDARRQRLAAARTGFEMGIPFNELNRVLDLGFKPLPWGNQGFVAATLQKLGSADDQGTDSGAGPKSEIRSEPTESRAQTERRGQPRTDTDGHESTNAVPVAGGAVAVRDPFVRAIELVRALGKREQSQPMPDPRLASRLRRFLFAQRGRVLARLSAEANPATEAAPEELLEGIFELQRETDELAKLVPAVSTASASGLNQTIRTELLKMLRGAPGQKRDAASLADTVKGFYNQNAEPLLAQAAGLFLRDPGLAAATPKASSVLG